MMLSAETVMRQSSMTADVWMRDAKSLVETHFREYSDVAKATLIAGYVTAAAGDEIAMYLRALAESDGLYCTDAST